MSDYKQYSGYESLEVEDIEALQEPVISALKEYLRTSGLPAQEQKVRLNKLKNTVL